MPKDDIPPGNPGWGPTFFGYDVDDPDLARYPRRSTLPHGFGGISFEFWSRVVRHAKRRRIEFKVTAEQAWGEYISQAGLCALTGEPIWFSVGSDVGGTRWLSSYLKWWNHPAYFDPDHADFEESADRVTASLDRIDSSQGYTWGNIQWVHKRIQGMKMGINQGEFIEWCKAVAQYMK